MKLSLLLLLLIFHNTHASTYYTTIVDIFTPEESDENYLILVGTGEVLEVTSKDKRLQLLAYQARETKQKVKIKISDSSLSSLTHQRRQIEQIEWPSEDLIHKNHFYTPQIPTPMDNYTVSELLNFEEAQKLFNTQRTDTRWRSQCYNRAHVWTWELTRHQVNTGKIFLFFTRKYIRNFNYRWWFHVTPYVEVKDQSEVVIMDREFTKKPTLFTQWKNIFMYNHAPCPQVEYYSDYHENQYSNYCYIVKASMYYWQPYNLDELEKKGAEKLEYIEQELRWAYSNAIGYWDGD